MPEPAAVRDIPTAFGAVRVYRFGTAGDPLVLLPGRCGTSIAFRAGIPELARRHRVHTVDPLGEPGRSEQTAPIRDAGDQARWLDDTLARLGLGRAHLLGVSTGGWLAANLAVRRPERVASLTLADPVATFAPVPPGVVLRALPVGLRYVSSWARPRFLRWATGADPADTVEGRLLSAGFQHFRTALPRPVLFTDEQLRALAVPVLAIIAGRSVVHDPRRAHSRARALLQRGEVELWPDAAPVGEVAERASRFLAAS
ncbi:alpha/beta hydrolase [Amycolatopsis sp. NPDC006131]|uniref:alpha/beta fold hydrolase n=1 Tax=Amycolatopsis sp. NPDC006131 TaxID=3156731 RepID=UPI0033B527CD